jgi:hypothetical protein
VTTLLERSAALNEITAKIADIKLDHPVRVAIDERDGAGKTMLGDEIREALRVHRRELI